MLFEMNSQITYVKRKKFLVVIQFEICFKGLNWVYL